MNGQQSVVHTFRPAFLHQGNIDQGLFASVASLGPTVRISSGNHTTWFYRLQFPTIYIKARTASVSCSVGRSSVWIT